MRMLGGLLAMALAAGTIGIAHADTAIATKWRVTGEGQNDCMNHASNALYGAGFDKADPGSQTISGKHGDYTASIRCVAEQNIVFFVLSGPSSSTVARYLDTLYGRY
jgi:hypothetical protein